MSRTLDAVGLAPENGKPRRGGMCGRGRGSAERGRQGKEEQLSPAGLNLPESWAEVFSCVLQEL